MDEDQIYRQAYLQSLPLGVITAVILTCVVGVVGLVAPLVVMHMLLRIAISFGVMWCVLQALYIGGGGLTGFRTTATGWVLANAAMFGGLLISAFASDTTGAPPPPPDAGDQVVLFLSLMLFLQFVGTTLAGWLLGD